MAGIVAENAERCRIDREMLAFDHRQSDPPRGQYARELPVREKRDVALQRAKMGDEPICPIGNRAGHLSPGTTVAKDIPARSPLANVHSEHALVIAIVPLCQVRFRLGRCPQSGQLACSLRTLPWAGEHTSKLDVLEPWSELTRLILAVPGQRKVRAAGVLARQRPLGFAVALRYRYSRRSGLRWSITC